MYNNKYKMSSTVRILKNLSELTIIGNEHAFLEILKNSFDEDATKVQIKLESSRLMFLDNGYGFSEKGFESFCKAGYTSKNKNSTTPLGRVKTGSNGSGAYSFIRLGRGLEIRSKNTINNFDFYRKIDWNLIYENPNDDISILEFKDIPEKMGMSNPGALFSISQTSINLNEIERIYKEISFCSLDPKFSYTINGQYNSRNILKILKDINEEKSFFSPYSLSFEFSDSTLKLTLVDKTSEQKPEIIEKQISDMSSFKGVIYGEYVSLILNVKDQKLKNILKDKYHFIKNKKGNISNNFYNNDMLVITDEKLGINFDDYTLRGKTNFKFRNPFGFTAIKNTNLQFNESRNTIVSDSEGVKKEYDKIIDFIISTITKEFTRYIDPKNKITEVTSFNDYPTNNFSKENIGFNQSAEHYASSKKNQSIQTQKLKIQTVDQELLEFIDNRVPKFNSSTNKNQYSKAIAQCLSEIKSFLLLPYPKNNYIVDYNISFHAVVRVFCEIAFIYKIYDNFNKSNEFKSIQSNFKNNKYDSFNSIASLLSQLDNNRTSDIQNFKKEFLQKVNLSNLNDIKEKISNLNVHIHNPNDNFKASVSKDLIKVFLEWIS